MKTLDRPETHQREPVAEPGPRRRRRRPRGRRPAPAGRVLIVMLVGLVLWLLLAAPSLKRSAEASPDGARRTVSLAVLTPIVAASDLVGIEAASEAVERAIGRDPDAPPGGELFADEPEAIPSDFGVDPSV